MVFTARFRGGQGYPGREPRLVQKESFLLYPERTVILQVPAAREPAVSVTVRRFGCDEGRGRPILVR